MDTSPFLDGNRDRHIATREATSGALAVLLLTVLALGNPRPALGDTAGPGKGLIYSTFLGGSALDEGHDIAVDDGGYVYLVVFTRSPNFPVTAGSFDATFNGIEDTVIMKLDPTGSIVFSTLIGGSDVDRGLALQIDGSGSVYVVGRTFSADFPVTSGAFDTTHNGLEDCFILKLDPSGSNLVYSTYVGGASFERAMRLAIDGDGNAYAAGASNSHDFPVSPGAFDTTFDGPGPRPQQPGQLVPQIGDGFALKLDPTGSVLLYSTFLGGIGMDALVGIAVDGEHNAYVTGFTESGDFPVTADAFDVTYNGNLDSFAAKLDSTGSTLMWSTFFGGTSVDRATGRGIVIDTAGNSYLLGGTFSPDFPVTPGSFDPTYNGPAIADPDSADPEGPMGDSYLLKLDPTGGVVFGTYLGGSGFEKDNGIVVDRLGEVYLSGRTSSADFPMTAGAFDSTHNGGEDCFLLIMDPHGSSLIASTFLGGSGLDKPTRIAVDQRGTFYVTGYTRSMNFPVTLGAFDTTFNGVQDAYMTRIALVTTVGIDVKPGSEENPVNLGSSEVIPVAVFSSADFDATQIDPTTVTLAGASVRRVGNNSSGVLLAHREDVDGDGLLDLVLQIATDQLELEPGTMPVRLRGRTLEGVPVRGEDVVTAM